MESRRSIKRSDQFLVNWYESDINGKAKLSSLCNYLQESAWRQAGDLGFGFNDVSERNQVWVVVALAIEMERYPDWGTTIRVETWPRDLERLFAYRDFRIFDHKNQLIGAASSSWMVIDIKTRKPQRLEVLDNFVHMSTGESAINRNPELLKSADKLEEISTHHVEYSEIDHNDHVNNTRYVDWCMNAFPVDHHKQWEPSGMTVNYISEVRSSEKISILANTDQSPVTFLEGRRSTDDKIVLRMSLKWRRR